jgi:hypothetical protein
MKQIREDTSEYPWRRSIRTSTGISHSVKKTDPNDASKGTLRRANPARRCTDSFAACHAPLVGLDLHGLAWSRQNIIGETQ